MLDDQSQNRARKGTRSCTECRRRKVRCIRFTEDSEVCRGCEERGSTCTPQRYSSQPRPDHKLPSRQRISQLELQVASLSKAVHGIEFKLGHQPSDILKPRADQTPESQLASDDSDDDLSVSDALATEPSHLRSLFQNDWLSVDVHPHDEQLQDRKAKATGHILAEAKQALQKLIPSKEYVLDIPNSAFKWLVFLDTLFPHKLAAKSQHDILESYDDMRRPDVDALSLALWLLAIAITAQQVPHENGSPSTQFRKYKRWVEFSHEVSDTVERSVLSHDRLVGTIQGLAVALHYFRLQISQGNFQKAWIRLRHYIVIAELMGLPKASQTTQLSAAISGVQDEMQLYRAQLWESICAVDQLFGMITSLPPGTSRYCRKTRSLVIEGVVQPWEYLARLTDIAAQVQQLDEMNMIQGLSTETCTTALELAQKLKRLASQTPESWWTTNRDHVKPDNIVQFLHYSILMRVYLPFTVQQNSSVECFSPRLACMEVCESVVQRYRNLRQMLPPGFLLAQVLDLQAFTATIVLLLTIHNSLGIDRSDLCNDKARIESEVTQVVELMSEKSREMTGSGFARNGATTISSLRRLLRQEYDAGEAQELILKVPLLGKVHVRRNVFTAQPVPQAMSLGSTHDGVPSEQDFWRPTEQFGLPMYGQRIIHTDSHVGVAVLAQEAWPLDPFSWSIEDDQENFFQDTLMAESFDQLATWQNADTRFPF
ncbi:putative Zn(II)2Cys6 transcription factor [Hyaloscypha variabilis]